MLKTILETLRQRATEPLDGSRSEILPWDRGAPWELCGAARAALGLILATMDDTFVLCEDAANPVTVGDLSFGTIAIRICIASDIVMREIERSAHVIPTD